MEAFSYTIKCEIGIHARPAAMLVKKTQTLSSDIILSVGNREVNAKKLLALLKLGVTKDTRVTVRLTGIQEVKEARILEQYFKENL